MAVRREVAKGTELVEPDGARLLESIGRREDVVREKAPVEEVVERRSAPRDDLDGGVDCVWRRFRVEEDAEEAALRREAESCLVATEDSREEE